MCFAGCGRFGVGAVSVADQLLVLILASNAQLLFERRSCDEVCHAAWVKSEGCKGADMFIRTVQHGPPRPP